MLPRAASAEPGGWGWGSDEASPVYPHFFRSLPFFVVVVVLQSHFLPDSCQDKSGSPPPHAHTYPVPEAQKLACPTATVDQHGQNPTRMGPVTQQFLGCKMLSQKWSA